MQKSQKNIHVNEYSHENSKTLGTFKRAKREIEKSRGCVGEDEIFLLAGESLQNA